MKKFNLVVCGGTFDHFHKGHKEFLRYALSLGNKVITGLTTDIYIKGKNDSEWIEDYPTRKKQLEQFLDQEKAKDRMEIEPIDDIFIPKIWEKLPIEAIIVAKNTISAANKINLRRKEQRKYPLKIEIAQSIKSENNEYISSSRIRNGEINREGKQYLNPYWLHHDLIITENLRKKFKKPFGMLIKNNKSYGDLTSPFLITVGDVTAKIFNKLGLKQNISVVDFRVARHKEFFSFIDLGFSEAEEIIRVDNPPGHLTSNLFKAASDIFESPRSRNNIVVKIEGEEDLSVLALALRAPLNSIIFYGQPGKGVVRVDISEKIKEVSYNLVNQFETASANTRGY